MPKHSTTRSNRNGGRHGVDNYDYKRRCRGSSSECWHSESFSNKVVFISSLGRAKTSRLRNPLRSAMVNFFSCLILLISEFPQFSLNTPYLLGFLASPSLGLEQPDFIHQDCITIRSISLKGKKS